MMALPISAISTSPGKAASSQSPLSRLQQQQQAQQRNDAHRDMHHIDGRKTEFAPLLARGQMSGSWRGIIFWKSGFNIHSWDSIPSPVLK